MPLQVNVGYSPRGILNLSNVPHRVAKMAAMPAGWTMVDDYREDWDREHVSVKAMFRGPWGTRDLFINWCLGYSTSILLPNAGPPQFNQSGQVVLGGGGAPLLPPGGGQVVLGGESGPFIQPGGLVNNVGGGGIQNNPAAVAFLSRVPPCQHWRFPYLYCVNCEVIRGDGAIRPDPDGVLLDNFGNPIQDNNGNFLPAPFSIAYYDSARARDDLTCLVRVTYGYLEYSTLTDQEMLGIQGGQGELERNVERKVHNSVGMLPLQGTVLKFFEGPRPNADIPENAKYALLFTSEYSFKWLDVPDPPMDAIRAAVGCTNADVFDGARGFRSFPPGSLLMEAPQISWHRNPAGRRVWDIDYTFMYREPPAGWNKYPAADSQGNQFGFYGASFTGKPDGPTPYKQAPFAPLFQVPPPQLYEGPG
jgi:hypothetical protein